MIYRRFIDRVSVNIVDDYWAFMASLQSGIDRE
jgi:hypothetical protein